MKRKVRLRATKSVGAPARDPYYDRKQLPFNVGRVQRQDDGTYQLLEAGTDRIEDRDGWPIAVGHVMRRGVVEHPVLGSVPGLVGRVLAIYRWSDAPDKVVVQLQVEGSPNYFAKPEHLARSSAAI